TRPSSDAALPVAPTRLRRLYLFYPALRPPTAPEPAFMRTTVLAAFCAALLVPGLSWLGPDVPVQAADPKAEFQTKVVGFLQKHCVGCHGEKTKRADLSLHTYTDEAAILKARKLWTHVTDQVHQGVMPPPERPRPAQ